MISINPIISNYPHIGVENTKHNLHQKNFKKIATINENNNEKKLNKLMEASKAFEALLVKEMFKTMKKNPFQGNLIKENNATKLFKDFLNTEHSQVISQTSNLGIARMIYQQQSLHLKNVSHETSSLI